MVNKEYHIPVVFTITIETEIMAPDLNTAIEEAERGASREFENLLNEGYLGLSDFTCEAQES